MIGQSLAELDIRANFGLNILAVKREKAVNVSPEPEERLYERDMLVILGADQDIRRFRDHYLDE